MASTAPQQVRRASPAELLALMDEGQPVTVVDVCQPPSYDSSLLTILGAIRIPLDEIARRYREISPDHPVITFCACRREATSAWVTQFLLNHGYRHVWALQAGFDAWEALEYPAEERSET